MRTNTRDGTRQGLIRWRREKLVDSRFPFPLAVQLAKDSRYDLHALIDLVERGCRPELAARILAPLDDEVAA